MHKKYFSIKSKKFMIFLALALLVFVVSLGVLHSLKQGLVFSTAIVFIGALNLKDISINRKGNIVICVLIAFLSSFSSVFLTQASLNEAFLSLGFFKICLGMIICLIVFLTILFITLDVRLSAVLTTMCLLLFSTVNYYVYLFRGSELAPSDLLSVRTAAGVVSSYSIPFAETVYLAWMANILLILLIYSLPSIKIEKQLLCRIGLIVLEATMVCLLIFASSGLRSNHWMNIGTAMNGYLLNFFLQLDETVVRKPEGYSAAVVNEHCGKYESQAESIRNPDIFVIMDESFADLRKLGDNLNTNTAVSPFIESLKEDTIRGYTLSSVFGGGTPNSEFEFLTGNSYMYLPYGSIAFQQYVDENSYSIVKEFNKLGYKTIGMHPYVPTSWMRNTVYPYLGFKEDYYLDDFPKKNMIRKYVSDQEMFEFMINLYEQNKKNNNVNTFMFGVTMQNHGGYDYEGENYNGSIKLNGYNSEYSDAEQYLSLIHETDRAIEYLIEYLKDSEHEVVVVFFGDHYPRLSDNFYNEIHSGTFSGLDQTILKFEVPFFVWSNYDIEEREVELTSLNFLSNYMLEVSDITFPAYNQFLSDVNKIIPAMNSRGYYSLEQKSFIPYEQAEGKEKAILDLYGKFQYNNLFDESNRNEQVFPAN